MKREKSPGLSGKGTPGRRLEKAAEGQAGTTGGLNLPGMDVNREGTQGDAAAGDPAAGASMSVGEDHLSGPEQWDISLGGPVVDASELDNLFDEMEFPTTKYDILAELERREDSNPVSGVNVPDLIAGMDKERFMNLAELTQAVREELSRKAHSA